MAPPDKIFVGQGVRVRGIFIDPATRRGVDPGDVMGHFRRPDGTIIDVTATQMTNEKTGELDPGHYVARVVADAPGRWYWRIDSAPPGEAAQEGYFNVEDTLFSTEPRSAVAAEEPVADAPKTTFWRE